MDLERVKSEAHTRSFQIQVRGGADKQSRTVELAFSSEEPYLRWFGYEILDHSSKSIRMDRIASRAPLLLHHDHRDQVGVVESVSIDADRTARAVVRFGSGERASEIFNDVIEGIRSQVSVGYRVHDMKLEESGDEGDVYRVTDWEPFEISIVSVAADPTVGVGRSDEESYMDPDKQTRSQRKQEAKAADQERERAAEILAIGEEFKCGDLATKAVKDGDSIEEFRATVMGRMKNNTRAIADVPPENFAAGMPADNSKYGRAMGEYSVLKLIRGIASPKDLASAGLELEISQDMQRELNRESQGVLVPYDVLVTQQGLSRAVTAGGSGANIIATDHLAGSFIDVLRNSSHVLRLNPTVLRGLQGHVDIPKKLAGAGGYWIGGDDSDSITESDLTLGKVSLSPNTVGGAVRFSHKMIIQSSPDIESMVRMDLADMIGVEIDAKAIAGDGTGNTPKGILNQDGVNSVTFAGLQPTWSEVVGMETSIADDNANVSSMAYLATPASVGHFKTTQKFSEGVDTIWESLSSPDKGVVNGYPCLATKNVPHPNLILGAWSQLLVGFWGGIELAADGGGTNFLKGSVTVRVLADVDTALRQAESFCVGTGTNP